MTLPSISTIKPKISSNCKLIDWGDKCLFIDPEVPNWTCANFVGALILSLCNGKNSVDEIASIIARLLDSDQDSMNEEVTKFIKSLDSYSFLSQNNFERQSIHSTNMGNPQVIYYNVTNRCNLKCPFCYINAGEPLEDELNYEDAIKCIDEIVSLKPQTLVFCGGEPLMREDLFDLAAYAKRRKLRLALISNGSLITDKNVERLTLFDVIQISLEASKSAVHDKLRGEGTFNSVMNSIKLMKNAGVNRVAISPVVTQINASDLPNLLDFVTKFRLELLSLNFFIPAGRGKFNQELSLSPTTAADIFNELTKKCLKKNKNKLDVLNEKTIIFSRFVKKMNCGAGTALLSIAANGDVYPCHVFHIPEFKAGTIKNDSLKDIYRNSSILAQFRATTVDSIEECKECYLRYFCGGGCRAAGYHLKQSLLTRDPLCEVYKSLIEMKLKFDVSETWDEI